VRTPALKDSDVIRTQRHFREFGRTVFVVFYEKTETWSCPDLGPEKMSWTDLHKKIFQHLVRQALLESKKENRLDLSQL